MNNKKTIVAIIALILLLAIAVGVGAYLLQKDDKQVTPKPVDPAEKTQDYLTQDGVDLELNKKASQIEDEANKLMESDPLVASDKYKEAADAYKEAGNEGKAADMSDNASTAGSMTTNPNPSPGDAVITPAGSDERL